jgi:hypothetical protein
MTKVDRKGRVHLTCDRCPVQLDLGPEPAVRARNRMPSGWFGLGKNEHLCPSCAQTISFTTMAQATRRGRRLAA